MSRFLLPTRLLYCLLVAVFFASFSMLFLNSRQARFDQQAVGGLLALRDAVYALQADNPDLENGTSLSVQVFNMQSTDRLPAPFDSIEVNPDMHIHYFIHVKRGRGTIFLLSLSHAGGKYEYRWSDVYGARRQQKVSRSYG